MKLLQIEIKRSGDDRPLARFITDRRLTMLDPRMTLGITLDEISNGLRNWHESNSDFGDAEIVITARLIAVKMEEAK